MPTPSDPPTRVRAQGTERVLAAIGWFIPDRAENADRVLLLRKQLYVVLCFLVAANALFFSVLHRLHHIEGRDDTVIPVLWALCAAGLLLPFLLRLVGTLRGPAVLLMGVFVVGVTAVAWFDGGTRSGAMFWLLISPLIAAFLLGSRAGWAVAACAAAIGGGFYAASASGVGFETHISVEHAAAHHIFNFISVALFTAAVAWLYEGQTVGHLRALSGRLAAANDRLRGELSQRKQAQARAEQANRAKDTLLANMGHEFRTPLAGIIGCTDVLASEVGGEQAEFVGLIQQSAHRLLDTLNGVLSLAQIESGGTAFLPARLDLTRATDEAVEPLREAARSRGLTLEVRVSGVVLADPIAYREVVWHLVSNAVKFTECGGITVWTEPGPDAVRLHVTDTGMGIAPAFLPFVFEAFRQESDGNARVHEGAGVGLAVASRLAALMGGELSVRSAQGEGSTFTLRLPAWRPGPGRSAAAEEVEPPHVSAG